MSDVKRWRTSDNMLQVGADRPLVFGPDGRDDHYVLASDFDALAAELAEANATEPKWKGIYLEADRRRAECDALREENRKMNESLSNMAATIMPLRAALERYGRHENHCYGYGGCTCGLAEALRGADQPTAGHSTRGGIIGGTPEYPPGTKPYDVGAADQTGERQP